MNDRRRNPQCQQLGYIDRTRPNVFPILSTIIRCIKNMDFKYKQHQQLLSVSLAAILAVSCCARINAAETIQFNVSDDSGKPVACRVHLTNDKGEPQKAVGQPFWHDHFVCSGRVAIELAAGSYAWQIERGPEWNRASGKLVVKDGETASVDVKLERIARLRDEGWYSGDMHVHRHASEIERLMMAEDLDFAPVIGWWNTPAKNAMSAEQTEFRFDGHRVYSIMVGEDEREGGALLFYGLDRPLDLSVHSREFPSPMSFVQEARQLNKQVWIDIEKPFWWDVPTWLATGQMNSIGIANNHMCRAEMLASEAWGKPRDVSRLPGPRGNGFWSQEIYYHILNAGIRIPPSAGSASGVLPNPVGYNRVYVHLDDQKLTRNAWFAALAAGRCFVTNGPLLRVKANGDLPGGVMRLAGDKPQMVEISIQLTTNDRVSAIEIIHNGNVVQTIPCADQTDQHLKASLNIDHPGWFLVRANADVENTFRFASTAPWYIESDSGQAYISQTSSQFFLDWVNERIERVNTNVTDDAERQSVLQWHVQAREFWANRVNAASADIVEREAEANTQSSAPMTEDGLRLTNIVRQLGQQPETKKALRAIAASRTDGDLDDAVEPLTLFSVSVNPESRVKIASTRDRLAMQVGVPRRFLVECENTAGITAPLRIQAIDVSTQPPQPASWCEVKMIDNKVVAREFTSAAVEYKVVELTLREPGLHEVRFVADAGQGTQDPGFRASTDLLIDGQRTTTKPNKE